MWHIVYLARKDMNVNEHERLSDTTQIIKVNKHCCSTFHNHCRVFYIVQNSYHKMNVKPIQPAVELYPLAISMNATCWYLSAIKVILCI